MEDKMKEIAEAIRLHNHALSKIFDVRAPEGIEDLDEIIIRDILNDFNAELTDLDINFTDAANYYDNTNVQILEILENNRVSEDKILLDFKAFMRILLSWLQYEKYEDQDDQVKHHISYENIFSNQNDGEALFDIDIHDPEVIKSAEVIQKAYRKRLTKKKTTLAQNNDNDDDQNQSQFQKQQSSINKGYQKQGSIADNSNRMNTNNSLVKSQISNMKTSQEELDEIQKHQQESGQNVDRFLQEFDLQLESLLNTISPNLQFDQIFIQYWSQILTHMDLRLIDIVTYKQFIDIPDYQSFWKVENKQFRSIVYNVDPKMEMQIHPKLNEVMRQWAIVNPQYIFISKEDYNRLLNISQVNNQDQEQEDNQLQSILEESLRKYQEALEKTSSPKERQILRALIEDLNKQKEKMAEKSQPENFQNLKRKYEDYVEKSLKMIFEFYAKQTYHFGKNVTFERVEHESNSWDYGTFISFCKHFGISDKKKFTRDDAMLVFKRQHHKDMTFQHFKECMKMISVGLIKDENERQYIDFDKINYHYKLKKVKKSNRRPSAQKDKENEDNKENRENEENEENNNEQDHEQQEDQNQEEQQNQDQNNQQQDESHQNDKLDNSENVDSQQGQIDFNFMAKNENRFKTQKKQNLQQLDPIIDRLYNGKIDQQSMQKIQQLRRKQTQLFDFSQVQAFYRFLGIDRDQSFRSKIKNFHLPFNSLDKDMFRLLEDGIIRDRYQPQTIQKNPPKKLIDYKKQQQQKQQLMKQKIEENKRLNLFKQNMDQMMSQSTNKNVQSYGKLGQKQLQSKNTNNQISWNKLENLSHQDLKILQEDDFKPSDLFDFSDQEDEQYLKQYDLNADKEQKEMNNKYMQQQLNNYGQIKQKLRPTQKYIIDQAKKYNTEQNASDVGKNQSNKYSYKQLMNRANQIDRQQQNKQKQMMKGIVDSQNQKYEQGMKAVKKNY